MPGKANVIDGFFRELAILQPREKAIFQLVPLNSAIVLADAISTLRMKRATIFGA